MVIDAGPSKTKHKAHVFYALSDTRRPTRAINAECETNDLLVIFFIHSDACFGIGMVSAPIINVGECASVKRTKKKAQTINERKRATPCNRVWTTFASNQKACTKLR